MESLFDADVNYLAVVLAAAAMQPLGFLWYGKLFQSAWMEQRGLTADDAQSGPLGMFVIPVACGLLIAYGLARLVDMVGADSVGDCIAVAAFVWVSFAGSVQFLQINFSPKVPDKLRLLAIEGGYQLACFVIAGAIIGAFQ